MPYKYCLKVSPKSENIATNVWELLMNMHLSKPFAMFLRGVKLV